MKKHHQNKQSGNNSNNNMDFMQNKKLTISSDLPNQKSETNKIGNQ